MHWVTPRHSLAPMINVLLPLVFGLLLLLSALSRFRRDLHFTGMLFLVCGLVLVLHSGMDVSEAASGGLHVGWISQPGTCFSSSAGVRC